MKLSLQMSIGFASVFALVCFAVVASGLLSLSDITDAAERADARGYVGFWAFLGSIGVVVAVASWWLTRGKGAAADGDASR